MKNDLLQIADKIFHNDHCHDSHHSSNPNLSLMYYRKSFFKILFHYSHFSTLNCNLLSLSFNKLVLPQKRLRLAYFERRPTGGGHDCLLIKNISTENNESKKKSVV